MTKQKTGVRYSAITLEVWTSLPTDLRHPAASAAATSHGRSGGGGGGAAEEDVGAAVRVFARLRRGHLPVMGARVFARVQM